MGIVLNHPLWVSYPENESGERNLPKDPSDLLKIPGEKITKYHGQGTIGIVVGNDKWAYKILSPLKKAVERLNQRGLSLEDIFAKEGQLPVLSRHIIPRSYHQTENGVPYIKMRVGEKLSPEDLNINPIKLISHVGQGIADYQKTTGNVYYDIKLENIVKYEDNFFITDFSTPTICAESGNDGKIRQNVGSMYTRAPEVYSEDSSPLLQSDVFGLGSLLMKTLTGKYITEDVINSSNKNPDVMKKFYEGFDSKSWNTFIDKKLGLSKRFDFALSSIIKKALSIDPNKRYKNAQEFMKEFSDYQSRKKWISKTAVTLSIGAYLGCMSLLLSPEEYRHQKSIGIGDESDVVVLSSNFGPKFHYENIERKSSSLEKINLILPEGNFNNYIEKYDQKNQVLSPFIYGIIQAYEVAKRDKRLGTFFINDPKQIQLLRNINNCYIGYCRNHTKSFSDIVLPDGYKKGDYLIPTNLQGINSEGNNKNIFRGYRGDSNLHKISQQIYSKISPNGGTVDLEDFFVEVALGQNALKNLKMKANSDYYEDYKKYIYPEKREFIEIWFSNYVDSIQDHIKYLNIYDEQIGILNFNHQEINKLNEVKE